MRPRIFEQRIRDKQRPEHKRVDVALRERPRQAEWRQAPPRKEFQDTFLKRVGRAVLPRDLELKWGLAEPTPREKVRERVVRAGEAHLDILGEEKWRRRKETITEYVEAFRDIERKDVARAAKMTGVKFLNLATESIDFIGGLLARHAPDIMGVKGLPLLKLPREKKQEWVDFVNRNWERMPSHKLKRAVDRLEEAEFMQPSPEWQEATLKEKFGPEHIVETTLHAGTDVVASVGMVALTGPKVGIVALAAPVGADIREQAMEHGWTSDQADLLSVPTAVAVGFLERIVPARIFGGSLKIRNKFIGSFAKRLMETTFLEMGTEFTQETVQMLAEETFREIGFDEAKTRWAMATFGGAMGGAGMQSMATFVDGVRRDGLKMGLMIEEVGKAPDKMPELPGRELTTKILEETKGRTEVLRQFIENLTRMDDIKQVERDLINKVLKGMPEERISVEEFSNRVRQELLPLDTETTDRMGTRVHERTVLTEELRGQLALHGYQEIIYESPIETRVGDIHFPGEGIQRYFAHVRSEEMLDGITRRIIELQSDLFQKGRLEDLVKEGLLPGQRSGFLRKVSEKEIAQLQPYRNIWHERIIREEIKRAARDGKAILKFPTGETAMKVEGLGETNVWFKNRMELERQIEEGVPRNQRTGQLKIEDLKVEKEIAKGIDDSWIITDVLGEGKFKAVPVIVKDFRVGKQVDDITFKTKELLERQIGNLKETFDISGKTDTANPIYRFYEGEVQKFLKRIRPDLTRITDPQGVSWFETKITEADKERLIYAFKKGVPKEELVYDVSIKEADDILRRFFTETEVKFMAKERVTTPEGLPVYGKYYDALVEVVQQDGRVSSEVVYHEAFHAYFDLFIPKERRAQLIEFIQNKFKDTSEYKKLVTKHKAEIRAKRLGIGEMAITRRAEDRVAEEYLADLFAVYADTKKTTNEQIALFFIRIYNHIKKWIGKENIVAKTFEDIIGRKRPVIAPQVKVPGVRPEVPPVRVRAPPVEEKFKEAKPEVEPPVRKQPTAIERKMGIAPPLAPFVKKRETTLLKNRIRNIARGVREGRQATLEDVRATQTTLIKILEDSGLPAKDWAKFRRSVKNVRTPAELERKLPVLLARANRLIEMQEVRALRKNIGKELKRLTPVKVRGVMKGKLKPEGQERINIIRKTIEMSPEEAQIKLKSNLELLEKGIDPIMEAKIILENEALGVAEAIKSQRVGMEVGIEKLSSIEKRIQEIVNDIEFGRTARDRDAINRSEEIARIQKYLTEDVTLAGTKLDKTINTTPLHQSLFDKIKGRVMQFLDGNLDNLDFWAAKADSFYPESIPMRPDVPYMGWWRETRKLHEANRRYLDSTERDIIKMSNLIVENYNIKTGKDKIRWEKEMVEKINLGNFTLRDGTETTIKMTRQQLIAKYAQLQQEQGLLRLQFGNQWTNEIIDAINKKMRPQDKKMVQNVIDNWYPVIRKEVNPVHEKMTGLKIGKEFNYNPLPTKYADEMSDQLRLTLQEFQRRSTTPSAVKARVDLSKIDKEMEPQLASLEFDDFFATALKHSIDMRRYENFTEPIRDMRRLMTGDTRQALTQRFRRHFPQEMDKLMDQMASGALRDTQNISELWKVRSNFTTAVFAAEPTRLFKESTSSILWALELHPKSIIKATTDLFLKRRYKKTAQELWNNSPFLRTRYTRRTYERDTAITAAERTPLKLFTQRQDIIEKSLLFQKAGDKFGIYSFGISYYYYHKTRLMKDGVSETEAIKKAAAAFEESARRNQASGEAIDLGQYQRVGEIGPLFSQFKTTILAMLRQEVHAIRSLGIKHRLGFQNAPVPKETIARNLTKIALIHLQFMFFQFVADGFRWDEERQKRAFFMGPWGAPIILGDGIDTAVRIVTGDDVFDRGALTAPALSAIGSVFWTGGRGIKDILDGKTDYETLVETFFSIAIPAAHLFGIPAQNLHHLISRSHEFIKGERTDPRELIFSDYALEISREKQLPAPRRKREGVFEDRREGIFEGRREKIFEDRRERIF